MNRLIYPYSAYPLAGDIKSTAGSNQIIVTGLQQVPLDEATVGSPSYPAIINYSPLIGKYVATDITVSGGGGGGGSSITRTVICNLDGGGSTPSTGVKGSIQIPFAGTITGWSVEADVSGSISIDVAKHSGTQTVPVVPAFPADKISASAPITLSSQQANGTGASGVSTWTTTVNQWDSISFNVASISTVTRVTIWISILETL